MFMHLFNVAGLLCYSNFYIVIFAIFRNLERVLTKLRMRSTASG